MRRLGTIMTRPAFAAGAGSLFLLPFFAALTLSGAIASCLYTLAVHRALIAVGLTGVMAVMADLKMAGLSIADLKVSTTYGPASTTYGPVRTTYGAVSTTYGPVPTTYDPVGAAYGQTFAGSPKPAGE